MDAIAELESRVARYGADRYPVQRATALFHLGVLLTQTEATRARALLSESATLFEQSGLRLEAAKAHNALGASLRELDEPAAAAVEFASAAEALESGTPDHGAALFNLGLVRRDPSLMARAQETFAASGARREEAAAARERAALLLESGDAAGSIGVLEQCLERAGAAMDEAAIGAAENTLGLAYLASDRTRDATEAFRRAAAAHPRSVRRAEHAMAKANLALAYEACRDAPRARLAAKQALGVPGAPATVRAQARSVLARLGDTRDDLDTVLAEEDPDRWHALVREELVRWADGESELLTREATDWVAAQDERRAEALAAALFDVPPETMERVLAAVLRAGSTQTRSELERAASLFHAPQELRLREAIARLAP